MIAEQKGLCAVLGEPLVGIPCLDHSHLGSPDEGHVRGVLSNCANSIEGRYRKLFNKYVAKHTELTFAEFLIALGEYLNQDFSGNPLHFKTIEDERKRLERWRKETIESNLNATFSIDTDSNKMLKSELIDIYCQLLIYELEK